MKHLRAELKADLERAGLLGYHPGAVYAKAALLLALTALFLAGFFLAPWWLLKAPLFVAGLATSIALAMIGHDSGHFAISRNRFVNDLPGYLLFPVLGGVSLAYWRHKHNTLHHSYTNVDGKDPDIRIYPFAMHEGQRSTKRGIRSFVQQRQGLLFWPLATFTTLAMRVDGLHFHLTAGRKIVNGRDRALDLASLALHYACWIALPLALGASVPVVLGFYFGWAAASGVVLAAIFAPAHMTLPLVADYEDNFVLQLQTTQNLRTNRLLSYLLIGLDHQVEHHLFQRMSHLEVKRAAPVVRAFCERHGLPYHEQDWGRALWETTRRIDALPTYELLPLPPHPFGAPPPALVPPSAAAPEAGTAAL
jgi:fatty acid desaturase